jgi:hypothetical protein
MRCPRGIPGMMAPPKFDFTNLFRRLKCANKNPAQVSAPGACLENGYLYNSRISLASGF